MANPVFANSRQISGKSMSGKSICEFPDVCFTPPQTPATPPGVPLPYPNTAMASDTTDGSTSVQMGNEQIMLKDRSSFKKSMGDEAGASPKKGFVTSSNRGKAYFIAWSMDVMIEGENVVRHLDLTTHNHACANANGVAPTPHVAGVALGKFTKCEKEAKKVEKACGKDEKPPCPGILSKKIGKGAAAIVKALKAKKVKTGDIKPRTEQGNQATKDAIAKGSGACTQALRCLLRPYKKPDKPDGVSSCCPGQTPHHIPPWSTIQSAIGSTAVPHGEALCVCLEGSNHSVGSHGKHHHGINFLLEQMSRLKNSVVKKSVVGGDTTVYNAPLDEHVKVAAAVTQAQNGCSKECIEEQLRNKFGDKALKKNATHDATHTGGTEHGLMEAPDRSRALKAAGLPPRIA